ncbi:cytochrome P450 [Microvirga roseola]|uniref:cytochrome P450 n=1 Tax=Microvirga roseola TaxID=2883126 RepID=UPI001E658E61|nr:cytochrome P450 [Microvirga roseola]
MSRIPRDKSWDSTRALLSEGYAFIPERCRRYQSDLFETRLMLTKAVCMSGPEAAREFYEPGRFTRRQALPKTALWLLQDQGSVQTLDGEAHDHRKQMFMSLMSPRAIRQLADLMARHWQARIPKWGGMSEVVLHSEVQEILCRAVCEWAGVPLTEDEASRRTQEFAAMVDGAGKVGPRNWRGMALRRRSERWARSIIEGIRSGTVKIPEKAPAHVIALHRNQDGAHLDVKVAAVELINVLRPTVAVARFIVLGALAMHEHPTFASRLRTGDDEDIELFIQEIRRFYPFFPLVAGRVLQDFDWKGYRFEKGAWVLLDIYGTNRDPRTWNEPERFDPDRFRSWDGSAFNFIPQGGGDHYAGHRCAGEWITIELMKQALRLLAREMRYDVPEQDLRIDLAYMPALPESAFRIANVRAAS